MKKLYAAISIVLVLASLVVIKPARAGVLEPGQQLDMGNPLALPVAEISTPSYPVGINGGESKLVEYSLSETGNVSGQITGRTLQFFTQYDVPLSDVQGPYHTNIAINALETTSWNELVYLPKAVVDNARAMDEYAIVLKTNFSGTTASGARFESSAHLLLLLPPAAFSKSSPTNGADMQSVNPSLHWDSSVGAVDYEYCFDTVDNNSCDTDWTGTYWLSTYKTNAALQNLPLGTTFYWQVRANNMAGQTYANNGNWWSFTTCEQNLIKVTNTNDSGPGSLRQAIEDVCTGGRITFDPSLSGQTIALTSGLVIDRDLTLDASTLASKLSISGNNSVPVVQVEPDITVTLNHLTLKDAFSSWGALTNHGHLTLVNSTVSDSVSDYAGGGISNFGTLNIQDSSILNNSAQGDGGGIYNEGALTITNTIISNNSSSYGGGINTRNGTLKITGGVLSNNSVITEGGAIYNFGTASVKGAAFTGNSSSSSGGAIYHSYSGTFTVESSTFANNSSSSFGGGIYNDEDQLEIRNSTFLGNSSSFGGAIYNNGDFFATATLTLENNTFSDNTANQGGGLYNNGSLILSNSILANSITGADCHNGSEGMINSNGNNLIETNGASPKNCDVPALSLDPGLGPLSDNGGSTQTMALLADSPALDAGDNATCTTEDQRGIPRPQGTHCDLGAYEVAVTPVLIDPEAGEHVLSLRPTFDWHDLQNAIDYRIQISRNGSFTNLVKSVTVLSSQYSPNFNLPINKTLHWRVRARTASGLTAWSEVHSFSTPNPPGTPVLVSPVLNALNTNYAPLFRWKAVILPTGTQFKHYHLQVDNNSDFSSPEVNDTSVTNRLKPQFQVTTPLTPNQKYYWRVSAVNTADELSNWSAVWHFRSAMLPPVLLSPTDIEQLTNVPVFSWENTEGANKYQIVISRYENMSSPLVNVTVSGLSYSPTIKLSPKQKFYWHVRALGLNGPSPWSAKWTFITCNPPSIPVLVSPAKGSLTRDYTPTFNWANSSLPANTTFKYYEIEVDDNKDFSSTVIHAYTTPNVITDSLYTDDAALDPNTRYYWHVRAISTFTGNDQFSAWSVIRSLRTALQLPTLLAPPDDHTNPIDTWTPIFSWSPIDGATGYTIQVSTKSNFSTLLVNATVGNTSYQRLTPFPANRVLYWRVRTNGVNGPSSWSETFEFRTP